MITASPSTDKTFTSNLKSKSKPSCSGSYNCYKGSKIEHISLYIKYINHLNSKYFIIGTYLGMPSVNSKDCTGVGLNINKDGGVSVQSLHKAKKIKRKQ